MAKAKPLAVATSSLVGWCSLDVIGLTPNAIYFVAERRKPSGITVRNTSDSPGSLRRSAANHPSVGPKVDVSGLTPMVNAVAARLLKTEQNIRNRASVIAEFFSVQRKFASLFLSLNQSIERAMMHTWTHLHAAHDAGRVRTCTPEPNENTRFRCSLLLSSAIDRGGGTAFAENTILTQEKFSLRNSALDESARL